MALWNYGDTVYLNSGSMPMKVIAEMPDGWIKTVWQLSDTGLQEGIFLPECLTDIKPDDVSE